MLVFAGEAARETGSLANAGLSESPAAAGGWLFAPRAEVGGALLADSAVVFFLADFFVAAGKDAAGLDPAGCGGASATEFTAEAAGVLWRNQCGRVTSAAKIKAAATTAPKYLDQSAVAPRVGCSRRGSRFSIGLLPVDGAAGTAALTE